MMRPASIMRFEKAYLASIVLGLIAAAISWSTMSEALNDPVVQSMGMGTGFLVGTLAVSTLVSLLLWYFIARRASNIAKWIYVVIVALGTVSFLMSIGSPAAEGATMIFGLVNLVLQVYAGWQLFKPDAKRWLESKGAGDGSDPTVFE